MKARSLTIALLVAIAVLALSIGAVLYYAVPLDVKHLHADITIGHKTAFELTNDSYLHFGTIGLTNAATRSITITDIRSRPITATVYIDGPGWLSVSENPIRIRPGVTKNVTFTAQPTPDTAYGHYAWNVTVVYRRR